MMKHLSVCTHEKQILFPCQHSVVVQHVLVTLIHEHRTDALSPFLLFQTHLDRRLLISQFDHLMIPVRLQQSPQMNINHYNNMSCLSACIEPSFLISSCPMTRPRVHHHRRSDLFLIRSVRISPAVKMSNAWGLSCRLSLVDFPINTPGKWYSCTNRACEVFSLYFLSLNK